MVVDLSEQMSRYRVDDCRGCHRGGIMKELLWVDPYCGSDVAPGTKEQPMCTLREATAVAKRSGATIYLILPRDDIVNNKIVVVMVEIIDSSLLICTCKPVRIDTGLHHSDGCPQCIPDTHRALKYDEVA